MSVKIKKDFKFWVNVVTIVALTLLIVFSWDQIVEAFKDFDSLNIWALAAMIPIQLFGYYALARMYKDFFKSQGDDVPMKEMYKLGLELNFVNNIFPSGGVSGFSYMSIRMKSLGVTTAKSTLAQLIRFALTFISFLTLLLLALFMLSVGHNANPFIVLVATSIILLTVFGTVIGAYIISKPSRIKAFVTWLPKAINKTVKFLHITTKDNVLDISKVEKTLEDLHQDYALLKQDKDLIKRLLTWALLLNIAEVLTVYAVYVALGTLVNPGAVIIAYAVANFAGLIAVLPGGVGIYEGLMTATLASAGVPRGLALSATVIYRVVSMVLFLPIGYYFYHKALRKGGEQMKRKLEESQHEPTDSNP